MGHATILAIRPRLAVKPLASWLLLGCLPLVGVGCSKTENPVGDGRPAVTADEVVREMISGYQQADSYSDRGIVRLKYCVDGQWVQDEAKLAMKFVRPNRLRLRAYQLSLACDGDRLRAIVSDPQSSDLDGQVVQREAPPNLQPDSVYDDPLVMNVIAGGLGGPPVTLELLLAERPLENLLAASARREMLGDGHIQDRPCYRIRAGLDEGPLVFWIDKESHLLLRLEYPTNRLAAHMQESWNCTDVSLVAEFREARRNTHIDESEFRLPVPDGATLVSRFVVPPQPLASDLIGRLPDEFHFRDLEGRSVPRDSLLGGIAVLVWFNNHPASQIALRQVDRVRRELGDSLQASFYAVCTEPSHVGNSSLRSLGEQWDVRIPMVRDLEAFGRDVFRIPWAPTLVILDAKGIVQAFEVGANPDLAAHLPETLRRLSQGEDLAAEVLAKVKEEELIYRRKLAEATRQVMRDDRAGRHQMR
jgi:hypothetical protein